MNRKLIALAVAAILAIGAACGYWLAQYRAAPGTAANQATVSPKGERKILYWQDPMSPNVKFDKPGRSPFMDMPLVPVYADEELGGPAVHVDPGVAQSMGIRLGRAALAVLPSDLSAVGSVAFDERLLDVVQARVEGYVTRLHVRSPLEHVRRGQPLADILAPEWLAAQQEYVALLDATTERGRAIRSAARERLAVLGVPEAAIRQIEQTRKTDAATTVFSPSDGVVTELAVREGAAFMPGAPLFRINGLKTVWVNAEIPEAQVGMVPAGSSVEVRATAWPGATFSGRVAALLPEIDPQTRTLPVRIVVANPDRRLAPGMFVALAFAGRSGEPQLVVPSEAVIMTGERSVVISSRDGGFDVTDVTPGPEVEGKTVILSGLSEGQSVVLSGQFLIDSEASLRSAITRLETAGGTSAPDKRP
jgi:membrane fusion protein, copper/silver efflux system